MIRYFLSGIPSLLFEPVAVCALVALLTALFVFRKHHGRFYWIVTETIFFMLVWRLCVYNKEFSTRYSAILLYPGIILTAWFCFYLKEHAGQKNFLSPQERAWLPFVCVTALVIACIVKTLHYNPYDDHTVKICNVLKTEIAKGNFQIFSSSEHERIAYYTGIPHQKVNLWDGNCKNLKETLKKNRNYLENIYFVFDLVKKEPEPDAAFLKLEPQIGSWECLARFYTSRRKNKEIVLYRFTPAHPNIEIWEKPVSEISPNNLCLNGDFEHAIGGNELKDRIAYYKKIKASDFYTKQGPLFPMHWWLGVLKAAKGSSPQMFLTAEQPIAGKYSLEMNSNGPCAIGMNSDGIKKTDGIFRGFVRAKKDSAVVIYSAYWNCAGKCIFVMTDIRFNAAAGKTYKFIFPVRQRDISAKDQNFYIVMQISGDVLWDNIEFIKSSGK